MVLFEAFRRVLMHACLLDGDFFTCHGVARAVASAVSRIEAARDAATRIDDIVDDAMIRLSASGAASVA
jgi:TPP-dependent 2-oxoacid decarboxylase